MNEHKVNGLQGALEQLTTETLDEMLKAELERTPVDESAVRLILRTLRERENDYPTELTPGAERAWEKFQRDSAEPEKEIRRSRRVRPWVLRMAAVAAVLCLVILVIPQEAGAESFFAKLARWTENIVEFFGEDDNEGRLVEYEFKTDNPGLQQVYDAVVELGVTDPVVPMWLPEGCDLIECKTFATPIKSSVTARFEDETLGEIVLNIDKFTESVSHQYYKDDTQYETREMHGFTHNIMRNKELWVAIWTKDELECSISVDCQEDTLRRILESIYMMEDE